MGLSKVVFRSLINRSFEAIMDWHLRPKMLIRAIPPWEKIHIISVDGPPNQESARFTVNAKLLGIFKSQMTVEYKNYVPGHSFEVIQVKGPFKEWLYKMKVRKQGGHTCEVIDQFQFKHRLPNIFNKLITRQLEKRLMSLIRYKHEMLQNDLDLFEKYPFETPLKILITGATGFIGKHLSDFLEFAGHDIWKLSRRPTDKMTKFISYSDESNLEGFDAVIHLAGENIAKGWWTKKKKEAILNSRYRGTEKLVKSLMGLKNPPKTFICASAVGYYGDRGNQVLNENSSHGEGFLSEVCQIWERTARELEEIKVRVVNARFGLVMSSSGGVLKSALPLFKLGLGGKIGQGRQYMSWVALDDLIGALYHILITPSLSGPVNCSSPCPITNAVFVKELTRILRRWHGPPVPALFIRLLLGQKGEELLLASARIEPKKLLETQFNFHFPKLYQALEHVLDSKNKI